MAQHKTAKRTIDGKAKTLQRRALRAAKYATRELDLSHLSTLRPAI